MSNLTEKTTIYLNPKIKSFIKHKAVADNASVSEIINEVFTDMYQDLEDIKVVKTRRTEPTVTFEESLKELGLTYDDLRS